MRTIVLASGKGGVGKSTLTVHLAIAAELAGAGPVVLLDTDPQSSLARWWNKRKLDTPAFSPIKGGLMATLQGLDDLGTALATLDRGKQIGRAHV